MLSHIGRHANAVCAAILCANGAAALAAVPSPVDEPRRTKVLELVALIEEAVKDCKDVKLKDYFGTGGNNIGYEQIRREKDGPLEDPTFADAFAALKRLINDRRLFGATMNAYGRAISRVNNGQTSDHIHIQRVLLFAYTDDNLMTPVEKAKAKVQIMATLANELTHIFQFNPGATNAQRCDAEADSDAFSIKVLQALCAALMRDDASGLANESLDAIKNDAQAIKGLDNCLGALDISTSTQIQEVLNSVKAKLGSETTADGYVGRRKHFNDDIGGAADWSRWYPGGNDTEPALFTLEDVSLRQGFTTTSVGGADVFVPASPAGFSICDSVGFHTFSGRNVFFASFADPTGARMLSLMPDGDDDEIPELATRQDVVLPAGPLGLADIYDVMLYPGITPDLDVPGVSESAIMFDRTIGQVRMIRFDGNGQLVAAPVILFQDPLLTNSGGFTCFTYAFNPPSNPGVVRFVFADQFDGAASVIWFDVPVPFMGAFTSSTLPGQTIEQALESIPYPSMSDCFAPAPLLTGAPGATLSLSSIGHGATSLLALASAGAFGESGPVIPAPPIVTPDILLVEDNLGRASPLFVPRLGLPIDSIELDLNGDPALDRLDLVDHPPRLYISTGSPSLPPTSPVRLVESEQVAELSGAAGFDGASTPGDIRFATPIELVELGLSSSTPIVVVQRQVDFDGDLLNDDAVVVRRDVGSAFFVAHFYSDAGLPSFTLDQSLPLPAGFEPGRIEYLDMNGDGRMDVRLSSFVAAPPICLLNSANPPATRFSASQCKACPGDADGSGVVDFDDISSVIANWGALYLPATGPGDADADGVVDFNDINFVLSNWGAVCP